MLDNFIKALREADSKRKLVWSLFGIAIIIVLFVGYLNIYVPHKVDAILSDNGFTGEKGYSFRQQKTKQIQVMADRGALKRIGDEAQKSAYSPDKELSAEKNLYKSVNEISKIPFAGTWKIELVTKNPQDISQKKAVTYWSFNGTHETAKLQNTNMYADWRAAYQDEQRELASRQEKSDTMILSAGLAGAALGAIDNVDRQAAQEYSATHPSISDSDAQKIGNAIAETPK